MSSHYNNNYHNRQQYHHRGALTKLTSSTSSSVGTFHTIGSGGGSGGVGGLGARRAFGAGSSVARNVPKLVNTSSLRKENGGQDITAVLVNRHGGELS